MCPYYACTHLYANVQLPIQIGVYARIEAATYMYRYRYRYRYRYTYNVIELVDACGLR